MDRRRIGQWGQGVLLLGALAVATQLAPLWPKAQTVHYVLGDAAARVEEIDARWWRCAARVSARGRAPEETEAAAGDDWTREASFRYARGKAPRVVTHEPRLADGDYTVEIEIVGSTTAPAPAREHATVLRHVTLSGGVTSIDLAPSVPR